MYALCIPCLPRTLDCTLILSKIDECGGNTVERGILPTRLEIEQSEVDDYDAHPVTVTLRHLSEKDATPNQVATSANGAATQDGLFRSNLTPDDTHELLEQSKLDAKAGQEEIVHTKYVLGGDGAHSWVRDQLGFKLEGVSLSLLLNAPTADTVMSLGLNRLYLGSSGHHPDHGFPEITSVSQFRGEI